MAQNRSLILSTFLAAIALTIGAAGWYALRSARDAAGAEAITPGAPAAASASRAQPIEPVAPSAEAQQPVNTLVEDTATAVERAAVADSADRELAAATWVEGRVHFPDNTPIGEVVEIVANGKAFAHRELHRASVAPDGSFRVAFAKGTRYGSLQLDAPHLYLESMLKLKVSDPPESIVLEPLVGGQILGTVVAPVGVTELPESLRSASVQLSGWSRMGDDNAQRLSSLDESLHFDLRGIPPQLTYQLSFGIDEWVPVIRDELRVTAGETESLELVCTLGARVAGRVVDLSGEPVPKAGVEALSSIETAGSQSSASRQGQAADDGSFAIDGIEPGDVTITARRTGYLDAALELGALADGGVREGLELRLDPGRFVAGRVEWPSGEPAAGASVVVDEPAPEDGSDDWFDTGERHDVKVEASGEFRVTGLGPGPFEVSVQAPDGMRPEVDEQGEPVKKSRRKGPMWRASAVDVPAGSEDLRFVLQPGLTLAGRVVDESGAPVTRFTIVATDRTDARDLFALVGGSVVSRFEADDGSFVLEGLAEGRWELAARARGYRSDGPVSVTMPNDGTPVTIVVTHGATLSGVVVDATGAPVPRATVDASVERNRGLSISVDSTPSGSTNAQGEFEIGDAPNGAVKLTASHAGFADSEPLALDVAAGATIGGIVLRLTSGGAIQGELHASVGVDRSGWDIQLARIDGSGWDTTETDDSGSFAFERVTPGQYMVHAQRADLDDSSIAALESTSSRRFSDTVEVREGETAELVLGAPPSAPIRVTGTVRRGSEPLAGASVSTWHEQQQLEALTGPDGRYTLVVDGPGDYTFGLSPGEGGTQIVRHVEIPEGATSFTLDFELSGGRIAGRVLGADGKPLGRVPVQLTLDTSRAELTATGIAGWDYTTDDGAFAFENLPPELYRVVVVQTGFLPGSAAHAPLTRGGLRLTEGGAIEDLELRLEEAGSIEGTVRALSGEPAIGAHVFVRNEQGEIEQRWWQLETDGAGRFTVDGLAPGLWSVSARDGTDVSDESAPIRVRSGEASSVSLALRSGAYVEVLVEDSAGKLVGAAISIRDDRGRTQSHARAPTADPADPSTGSRYGPLVPGSYEISATNHDGVTATARVGLSAGLTNTVRLRLGG